MSTNLCWRTIDPENHWMPKELKHKISRKYWEHDGSLGGEPILIDMSDYKYFEGLRDAGVDGAEDILNALEIHGEIEISLLG